MEMKFGDLGWTKMRGWPLWPVKIVPAPASMKRPKSSKTYHFLYFFGSEDHAWVPAAKVLSNSNELIKEAYKKKSVSLLRAVKEFERECRKRNLTKCNNNVACEETLPREYTIKDCHVKIKRLDSKYLSESNTFVIDQKSDDDTLMPQRKRWKTNIPESAEDSLTVWKTSSIKRFGFIGFGKIGQSVLKYLLSSGYNVTIWDETCIAYQLNEAQQTGRCPADLIKICDVVLCSGCDDEAVKSVVGGKHGILRGLHDHPGSGKGFVVLAHLDLQTSVGICNAIRMAGGRYLAAPSLYSGTGAVDDKLQFLATGDLSLFSYCETIFLGMGKVKFLGPNVEEVLKTNAVAVMFFNAVSRTYEEIRSSLEKLELPVEVFNHLLEDVLNIGSITILSQIPIGTTIEENWMRPFVKRLNLGIVSTANGIDNI